MCEVSDKKNYEPVCMTASKKKKKYTYIGSIVYQKLCTNIMPTKTCLMERRHSVQGECVHMEALPDEEEQLLFLHHNYVGSYHRKRRYRFT